MAFLDQFADEYGSHIRKRHDLLATVRFVLGYRDVALHPQTFEMFGNRQSRKSERAHDVGQTGLAINLTEVGGYSEPRLKPEQACTIGHRPNHLALIPKGMRMWGYFELTYNHYAVLIFDVPTLERRFGEEFAARVFDRPKLRFAEPRIHSLIRMIIDIDPSDASAQLLGDSLTSAIFAILSAEAAEVREERNLPNWQVKRVTEYMRSQMQRQIELNELANIVGQSQWHFARAFKAATG